LAIENPTFSELWYRVEDLRPRLRSAVEVHRQHFRGQLWHVVRDPVSNDFFRLHPAAYRFVGLLDGRRTVARAWELCGAQLGDEGLTQTEAVRVLGQLYVANLLQADLPPDAQGLFQRYRRRTAREVRGQLANVLFLRMPLLDPDRLLARLAPLVRRAFTPVGLALWLAVLAAGGWVAASNATALVAETKALVAAGHLGRNLPLLYAAFILAKVAHEFGHAFACKVFGLRTRTGGEVHAMGIMFLVFAPIPYVDASSAWALRSKAHRVVVAAAGMMTELAMAAAAAVAWAWTDGAAEPVPAAVHTFALALILIAGMATLVFNANPLLRFDGYYILSDLIEIPNLADRSRRFLYHVVKRSAWGVRNPDGEAHSPREAAWLAGYGLASTAFRVLISVKILLMLCERFFLVGTALAAVAVLTWVIVPLGRFVRYLLADAELSRVRPRAVGVTAAVIGAIVGALALVPASDCRHVDGVAEPARLAHVHAATDGVVRRVAASPKAVHAGEDADVLVAADDPDLRLQRENLDAEKEILLCRLRTAQEQARRDKRYVALAQVLTRNLAELDDEAKSVDADLAALQVRAPFDGTWMSPRADRLEGVFVRRGERLGSVATMDQMVVRVSPSQRLAGMLVAEADRRCQVRLKGDPSVVFDATWEPPPTGRSDARGERFDIIVTPAGPPTHRLLGGQEVLVRFRLPSRPLARQWWRSLRQLAQRRLGR